MSPNSSLNRDSFQHLLESAFVVQQSRIDPRFLSAMMGVENLIAKGELGVDGTMNLVANSAQDVAGATGVAIGLLRADQLIFQAGSGCAAGFIGNAVSTSLTVPKARMSREILRVENASTDTRVEGEICRQFGAESLLILPIYIPPISRDRTLAGVVMLLFSEAHTFQESEIRTYRLMAGLVETALCPVDPVETSLPLQLPAVPQAGLEAATARKDDFREEPSIQFYLAESGFYQRCGVTLTRLKESALLLRPGVLAKIAVQRASAGLSAKPFHSVGFAVLAVALGLAFMTHGNRAKALPSSAGQGSTVGTFERADVMPVERNTEDTAAASAGEESKFVAVAVRRPRVHGSEIEYIGDDVTVHHFAYKAARRRSTSRVTHIGNDVTVRHFAP